jgi:hypothetical protein
MTQLWEEEVAGVGQRELAGASREGDDSADSKLRQYLREVFDQLENLLAKGDETDNGR